MDLEKLTSFLIKAKRKTYASGKSAEESTFFPGFKLFTFAEKGFVYLDTYVGDISFHGTEIVWFKKDPVWIMSYDGGLIDDKGYSSLEIFDFLRNALSRPNASSHRARGPSQLKRKDMEYKFVVKGTKERFNGYEFIKKQGKLVYELDCSGRIIIPKT